MQDGVTLKEHIESRLAAMDKATELALLALNERLAGMNEFREALGDVMKLLATKAELGRVEEDIRMLREYKATMDGKANQSSVDKAMLVAVIGMIIGLAGLALSIIK